MWVWAHSEPLNGFSGGPGGKALEKVTTIA